MAVKTLIEGIRDGLKQEMDRDERVVCFGEDVAVRGGVFRATEGLLEAFGEARVFDTPLGESGIAGVAIGMALHGVRPVAEIQFADYIYPAMNQIVSEAAKIRYRSYGDWGCPMVLRVPFGGGVHGGLYHSQSPEAYFAHTAGLKVVVPSTPYDAKGLLAAAVRDDDPVLFFEHKRMYRMVRGEVPEEAFTVPIGVAKVTREGTDLSIFAYGLMAHLALEAAEALSQDGISAEVVDLRTLAPLDRETIITSVTKTHRALVVYEASRTLGTGAEVSATIAEEALFELDAPIVRVTGPDVPAMPFNRPQEAAFMPTAGQIEAAARQLISS